MLDIKPKKNKGGNRKDSNEPNKARLVNNNLEYFEVGFLARI